MGIAPALPSKTQKARAISRLRFSGNLGRVLHDQGLFDQAIEAYSRSLSLEPNHAGVDINLGNTLRAQGRLDAALACYRHAIALEPGNALAHGNAGSLLRAQGRVPEAIAHFRTSLQLDPANAETYHNVGNCLRELGMLREAVTVFEQAIALRPHFADARLNLAIAHLLLGELKEGFLQYEGRPGSPPPLPPNAPLPPVWDGGPLHGARILLYAEQGLGDTLQFLRYVPLVQQKGGSVLLRVQRPLRTLAEQLPDVSVSTFDGPAPRYDTHCRLLSLPHLFGTTLSSIPADVPYLTIPEDERRAAEALPWPEQGLRVGLAWAGSSGNPNDANRSLTFNQVEPLLAVEQTTFFSLQLGDANEWQRPQLHDLGLVADSMARTAARLVHMDLVVTVDTAIAHLAGSLGVATWLMLPYDPDWRWMTGRSDSPWYPEMRLFRQPSRGDWASVVSAVKQALLQKSEHL